MKNRSTTFIMAAVLLFVSMAFAENVKITKGPVVEHAGDNSAVVAWSTNVASASIVRFGTDPSRLDRTAQMPWGGLTHRVTLKNLQPGTTYFFRADSSQAQGTGGDAQSQVDKFTTGGGERAESAQEERQEHEGREAHRRDHPELKLTNGPVLEHVGDETAVIAWSTDLPSSSIVRYGMERGRLDQTAEQPWGATTHRVELKNLRPNTRYYYSIHSAQGKNAPGQALDTPPQEFMTANHGREARR